jgi:hypothetical protein
MDATSLDPLAKQVLHALFELARRDCAASPAAIGRAIGRPTVDVARVLLVLDARRLVCARRARLTLRGLATASLLRSTHRPALPSGVKSVAATASYAHAGRTSRYGAQRRARA